MRRLAVIGGLLAAAAASGARAQSARPPGCTVDLLARLPLSASRGRFSAPVNLDGQDVQMMVDTGAQRAALSPRAADRLGLAVDSGKTFRTNGVGGRSVPEHPRVVGQVRLGPVMWPRYGMQAVDSLPPPGPDDATAPEGIVGADMLSSFDVELDFPGRTMRLFSVVGCGGTFATLSGYDALTPLEGPRNLFVIPVTVNGAKLRALIDTGANASILGRSAARAAGVDAAALKNDLEGTSTGTRGAAVASHRHRFDSLTIGSTRFAGPQIAVQDSDLGAFDMLLGMDYLRTRTIWLSYATGRLFIRNAAPSPAPPAP